MNRCSPANARSSAGRAAKGEKKSAGEAKPGDEGPEEKAPAGKIHNETPKSWNI
jgi:hypothetical protein